MSEARAQPHDTRDDGRDFGSLGTIVVLALISGIAAFGTDMYLPAFPAIRDAFDTSAQSVQLSLAVFLYGNAAGHLLFGPLSDRYGRRPPLLLGLGVYALASFGCALATSIEQFLVYRACQGAAAACGPVLVRALLNDRLRREPAAQMLALVTGCMALGAMLTPIAGGWLVQHHGWPWIFCAIGSMGLVLLATAALVTRETLPAQRRWQALSATEVARGYLAICRDAQFWCYIVPPSLMFAGVFAYVGVNSFLLIDKLGMAAQHHGASFSLAASAYVAGSFTSNRLVRWLGIERAIIAGLAIGSATALAAVVASSVLELSIVLVLLPGLCMFFAAAAIVPIAMSAAVSRFPTRAGSASAVAGFCQLSFAAASSAIVGALVDATTMPLHLFTLACCLTAAAVWFGGRQRRENGDIVH